jgi:tetratricopeptide (TPR) repeat protein
MYQASQDQLLLLADADNYRQQGDVYQAVKLYKLLVRKAPEWLLPHQALAKIFKERQEWKAVVHYNKKSVALDPSLQQSWWDLGIGTFAIGKKRQARRIWNKFGWTPAQLPSAVSVQLLHSGIIEMVWVQPLNPVSGIIKSIPHPQSDRSFLDLILFDREVLGYHVANQKRIPIYQELDLLKRSYYHTFSGIVEGATEADLDLFTQLAYDQGMGFEIWSNAARSRRLQKPNEQTEYYSSKAIFGNTSEANGVLFALSGKNKKAIHQLIKSWKIITLNEVHDLEEHL